MGNFAQTFPSPWTPADLTGNAQFAVDAANKLWLVTNTNAARTFYVYSSLDYGMTFAQEASYTFPNANPSFDPAVCLDSNGHLHIIGQRHNVDGTVDVVKFYFSTPTLTGPFAVSVGEKIGADYDIAALANLNVYIAVSVIAATGEALKGYEVTAGGSILHTNTLLSSSPISGDAFGSVSVICVNGTTPEIYTGTHPKKVLFKDMVLMFDRYTGAFSGGNWTFTKDTAFEFTILARHTDDRLTVVPDVNKRYLSQSYYTQDRRGLAANILLAYKADITSNAKWDWKTIEAVDPSQSLTEPVFMVNAAGATLLAYIQRDYTSRTEKDGPVKLFDVSLSDWGLTPHTAFRNVVSAAWLRGAKQKLPTVMNYGFVTERQADGVSSFYSGFNLPPVAGLSPSIATISRGVPLVLDASTTYDRNFNPLKYTWSATDPSTEIIITPDDATKRATLLVNKQIGPAAKNFKVQLVVEDLQDDGVTSIDPPVTITNIQITGNVLVVTANNSYAIGKSVVLYDLLTSTFLNSQTIILTAASPTDFQAAFTHADVSTADTGKAVISTQYATCAITLPFLPPPAITWVTNPLTVDRNSQVIITPNVTHPDPNTSITYTWSQVSGTPMEIVGDTASPSLTFTTNDSNVHGEDLVFKLAVNDGVNAEVTSTVTVKVRAVDFSAYRDEHVIARSTWTTDGSTPATIAQRNSSKVWGALQPSTIFSDFKAIKRSSNSLGSPRYLVISRFGVLIYGGNIMFRKLIPVNGEFVQDAVHTETDETIELTTGDQLLRFSIAPLLNSENPDGTIMVENYTTISGFEKIYCTVAHNDRRMIALSGPQGCLLLQVHGSLFTVVNSMQLTVESGLLYGADNVRWVRFSNLESLHLGKLLIGTMDSSGVTYETLIDLSKRRVIGTWNFSRLRNRSVTTGELLFEPESQYVGAPQPPVLQTIVGVGNQAQLSWLQERPDLVSSYQVEVSTNSMPFTLVKTVLSGLDTEAVVQISLGVATSFRVRAISKDGTSGYSNIQTVTL